MRPLYALALAALLVSLAACDSAEEPTYAPIEGFYSGALKAHGSRDPAIPVFLDLRTEKPDGDRTRIGIDKFTTDGIRQPDGRFALTMTPVMDAETHFYGFLYPYIFNGRSSVSADSLQGGMAQISETSPEGVSGIYVILRRVIR